MVDDEFMRGWFAMVVAESERGVNEPETGISLAGDHTELEKVDCAPGEFGAVEMNMGC